MVAAQYIPRQPTEHWRTTGRIFDIVVDGYIERVKGGRVDRVSVVVSRYGNDDPNDTDRKGACYPLFAPCITPATRRRLVKFAPLASANRKRNYSKRTINVLPILASVPGISVSIPPANA